jgi:hypothetical protein
VKREKRGSPEGFLDAEAIAVELAVSRSTAFAYLNQMPCFPQGRVRRVSRADFNKWVAARTVPPKWRKPSEAKMPSFSAGMFVGCNSAANGSRSKSRTLKPPSSPHERFSGKIRIRPTLPRERAPDPDPAPNYRGGILMRTTLPRETLPFPSPARQPGTDTNEPQIRTMRPRVKLPFPTPQPDAPPPRVTRPRTLLP